jgi:hypothetical protein
VQRIQRLNLFFVITTCVNLVEFSLLVSLIHVSGRPFAITASHFLNVQAIVRHIKEQLYRAQVRLNGSFDRHKASPGRLFRFRATKRAYHLIHSLLSEEREEEEL